MTLRRSAKSKGLLEAFCKTLTACKVSRLLSRPPIITICWTPAIWRRFDVTLRLDNPVEAQIAGIVASVVPEGSLSKSAVEAVAALCRGMSGSDITGIVKRALQDSFLFPGEPFAKLITLGVLARLNGPGGSDDRLVSKKELVIAIRKRTGGDLAIRQIAGLVGCSPTHAHQVITAWESNRYDDQ